MENNIWEEEKIEFYNPDYIFIEGYGIQINYENNKNHTHNKIILNNYNYFYFLISNIKNIFNFFYKLIKE